jgi:TolB-like protein/lipoprotein NlpI
MPGVSNAVFLSYASEDAEAAEHIATVLRAAGVEVWFDKSELRGGDAWDRRIRGQIRDCALFVPIISVNSQARPEGYFRLEWDLADRRTHLMGRNRAFVIPLCIDATPEREADVPDSFLTVQWTRLPAGAQSAAFVERVERLLSGETSTTRGAAAVSGVAPPGVQISASGWRRRALMIGAAVVIAGVVGYLAIERPWISKFATSPTAAIAVPGAFAPPPHSIAVLPFVNLSGDKEQEYFSDGLTEELLNSLADIEGLQVAARTSSFTFREHPDIATVAHKLNVGAVLEGSVRRSGNTVRVTTQLINAVTGFHLWSHTYDRNLGDVLKLQTDIAHAVASALKVSLLGDEATKIELGGTRNPAAFDAYLRGRKAHLAGHRTKDYQAAIVAFTEAIGLDPKYGLAYANRSIDLSIVAGGPGGASVNRERFDNAHADALRAIELSPDLAEGHLALAYNFLTALDFIRSNEEFDRAVTLAPGNARALADYGEFAVEMGRTDAGIAAVRRAVVLDPLNRDCHYWLGNVLYSGRRYKEALSAFHDALTLDPEAPMVSSGSGLVYYALGDFERARVSCESNSDHWTSQHCLAITYDKIGRHADAESALERVKASEGDGAAYQYAEIYTQWGNRTKALGWLDTAMRLRDSGLEYLKIDPLMDPLRKEPRFQAIERELKFPN